MRRRNIINKNDDEEDFLTSQQQRTTRLLKQIDLFPKAEEEVVVQTRTGGYLSILTTVIIIILFIIEIRNYFAVEHTDRIIVDSETSRPKIPITLNITWHRLSCADIEIVAMDIAGEQQLDVKGEIHKHRISANGELIGIKKVIAKINENVLKLNNTNVSLLKDGKKCGTCYGAELNPQQCCNTCKEVKQAYDTKGWDSLTISRKAQQCKDELGSPEIEIQDDEGCLVEGTLDVAKVNGNFHVALGSSKSGGDGRIYHQFVPSQMGHYDSSHTINFLSFGKAFPGQINPLAGTTKKVDHHESETASFQYFLQIVPVEFEGLQERTYQYTYTYKKINIGEPDEEEVMKSSDKPKPHDGAAHSHPNIVAALPGTFFIYEVNPFVVQRGIKQMSLSEFFTNVFGILGGVVAISHFLDYFVTKISFTNNKKT